MRILFVSGVAIGGSARSTRELAERLARRGHTVGLVLTVERARRRRHVHKRAVNLTVKLGSSPLARAVGAVAAQIGRRPHPAGGPASVTTWETIMAENSLPTIRRRFRPDVVVASSIDRMAWRRIRAELVRRRIPSVLYVREQNAFGHLTVSGAPPDLLVTNARVHAETAAGLGFDAITIPSLVSVDDCVVAGTREHVLLVNPISLYGVELALALAAARPDISFALAESWPLRRDEWDALAARTAALPNVTLRRFDPDPRALYADARLLLVPYRSNGRPRVVLEAQANGIPVLGSDLPAVREAIGPGGLAVSLDAPIDTWVAALSELLDDPLRYERYAAEARRHAARPEVDPDAIAARFEQVLGNLVEARARRAEPGASERRHEGRPEPRVESGSP